MSEYKLVPVDTLRSVYLDLDACQKVIWRHGGFDPAYWRGAQARLKEIDELLAAPEESLSAADYEEVLADHRRLARELDVLLNGEEGAAQQASLCDMVAQLRTVVKDTGKPILAAPDVSVLVGALERIERMDFDDHSLFNAVLVARAALAAHRKGDQP